MEEAIYMVIMKSYFIGEGPKLLLPTLWKNFLRKKFSKMAFSVSVSYCTKSSFLDVAGIMNSVLMAIIGKK